MLGVCLTGRQCSSSCLVARLAVSSSHCTNSHQEGSCALRPATATGAPWCRAAEKNAGPRLATAASR